jgi:hypothetical protein
MTLLPWCVSLNHAKRERERERGEEEKEEGRKKERKKRKKDLYLLTWPYFVRARENCAPHSI